MSSISDALKRAQEEREKLRAAGAAPAAPAGPADPGPPAAPVAPPPPPAPPALSLASVVLRKEAAAAPEASGIPAPTPPPAVPVNALTQALRQAPPPPAPRTPKAVEAVVEDYASKRNLNLPHAVVVYHDRSGAIAEQYRKIRDSLLTGNPKREPQAIVVTSSSAGEGKTTTVLNLGLSLVEVRANRVLLVDGCLEAGGRASLSSLLRLPAAKGIAELVATPNAELKDFVQATPWNNLFLLPAGAKTTPAAAAELLASAGFRAALRHLRSTFDWILIDTPAVQALPDAGLFAAAADSLLLAAALHRTPHKKIQSTLRRLHALNLPLKGTILTHA
jgi:Mrp family chromosome partitioning ATPase